MKMLSYIESRTAAYGCLEGLKIDPVTTVRACTPRWDISAIARMPQKGITMKIKAGFTLGQQLAVQADRFLEILDKLLPCDWLSNYHKRARSSRSLLLVCHKWTPVNCPRLKSGGPQNRAEHTGKCC
jgi:hypothetical protein